MNNLPIEISKQFGQLCCIAFEGMGRNQVVYSSHDLQSIGNTISSDLGLLVTSTSTSVYGVEKTYNFLHKTLQEFCAAWHVSKLSFGEQLKYINTYWSNNFTMVWRFYSGITGLKDMKILNCIYEAQNSEVCQVVGDHLNGSIDLRTHQFGTIHIGYFLSQYKGAMRQINANIWNDNSFQVFIGLL